MKLPNITNPKCPYCNGISKKKGFKKNKLRTTQRYLCRSCKRSFMTQPELQKSKTYNLTTILNTISNYNLGRPSRKNTPFPKSTIHNWIKNINLPMHRLRKNITKTQNPIIKHQFTHHKQPFLYQYHALKLDFARKFPDLINYLKNINTQLPKHIFENSERISQVSKETPTTSVKTRVEREIPHKVGNFPFRVGFSERKSVFEPDDVVGVSDKKNNYATKLADIALSITNNNKERHNIIENFMLINDTATIATEIPIYLKENEAKEITKNKITTNLTGHIDILQIRYHKIYLLDYKPEPINIKQTINQLRLYREALSKRTQIPIHKFKLAFFNDKTYQEVN